MSDRRYGAYAVVCGTDEAGAAEVVRINGRYFLYPLAKDATRVPLVAEDAARVLAAGTYKPGMPGGSWMDVAVERVRAGAEPEIGLGPGSRSPGGVTP